MCGSHTHHGKAHGSGQCTALAAAHALTDGSRLQIAVSAPERPPGLPLNVIVSSLMSVSGSMALRGSYFSNSMSDPNGITS